MEAIEEGMQTMLVAEQVLEQRLTLVEEVSPWVCLFSKQLILWSPTDGTIQTLVLADGTNLDVFQPTCKSQVPNDLLATFPADFFKRFSSGCFAVHL